MTYLAHHLLFVTLGVGLIGLASKLFRWFFRDDVVIQYRVQAALLIAAVLLLPLQFAICQLDFVTQQASDHACSLATRALAKSSPNSTHVRLGPEADIKNAQWITLPDADVEIQGDTTTANINEAEWTIVRSPQVNKCLRWFAAIYLWGIVTTCVILLLRVKATIILVRHSTKIKNCRLEKQFHEIIGKSTSILVSSAITSPCCLAIPKKIVVLPVGQIESLTKEQLNCILHHEAVHMSGNDWLVCWMEQLLKISLWFHPCAASMIRRLREDRELSCDAIVVRKTQLPRTYADALLACCQGKYTATNLLVTEFNSASKIKRRLEMLTLANRKATPQKVVFTWTIVALFVIAFASGQTVALMASPPQQDESKSQPQFSLDIIIPEGESDASTKTRPMSAEIKAIPIGRTTAEMYDYLRVSIGHRIGLPRGFGTGAETVLSANNCTVEESRVFASVVLLNLPEGSKLRALFEAKSLSIERRQKSIDIQLIDGRLEIVGHDGTIRFSIDSGADSLQVSAYESLDEVVLRITGGKNGSKVFVDMDLATETPKERVPPYRTTQFELIPTIKGTDEPTRVKMMTSYDMRLLEAAAKPGKIARSIPKKN